LIIEFGLAFDLDEVEICRYRLGLYLHSLNSVSDEESELAGANTDNPVSI
jgi:hypothetical protein